MHTGPKSRSSISADQAQDMAIEALGWLASEEARLERFLSLSGLGPQNLRRAAAEPSFLAAILDYLAANEPLLIEFSTYSKRAPEAIARAQASLAGDDP